MKICEIRDRDGIPIAQADPYMIKARDGRYYLYTTGGRLFSSSSLKSGWKYEGVCLEMPGQIHCWAPSVIEIEGIYYMYYSSMDKESKDEHTQTMRVAAADSPKGPFVYKKDILPPFSIDPHVVVTGAGLFIFYCVNDFEAQRSGTVILCDKMSDPYTVQNRPVCVARPTIDEEIYQRDRFRKGRHWHTLEGPFYFYEKHMHYLMYSGACYQNDTYFIGYCRAEGEEMDDLRSLSWKKYPDENTYAPLLKENKFVEGMGHNSVIIDEGKQYIVYHGRDVGKKRGNMDMRIARIDELFMENGILRAEVTP